MSKLYTRCPRGKNYTLILPSWILAASSSSIAKLSCFRILRAVDDSEEINASLLESRIVTVVSLILQIRIFTHLSFELSTYTIFNSRSNSINGRDHCAQWSLHCLFWTNSCFSQHTHPKHFSECLLSSIISHFYRPEQFDRFVQSQFHPSCGKWKNIVRLQPFSVMIDGIPISESSCLCPRPHSDLKAFQIYVRLRAFLRLCVGHRDDLTYSSTASSTLPFFSCLWPLSATNYSCLKRANTHHSVRPDNLSASVWKVAVSPGTILASGILNTASDASRTPVAVRREWVQQLYKGNASRNETSNYCLTWHKNSTLPIWRASLHQAFGQRRKCYSECSDSWGICFLMREATVESRETLRRPLCRFRHGHEWDHITTCERRSRGHPGAHEATWCDERDDAAHEKFHSRNFIIFILAGATEALVHMLADLHAGSWMATPDGYPIQTDTDIIDVEQDSWQDYVACSIVFDVAHE